MRSALITFFACFLGMLAALLVYHQYRKHEEAQAEAARDVALQARVEQGRKLAEKMIAEYATAQVLREDLVAASMAKNAVSEMYFSRGRMPAGNAEAGLGEPPSYRGQSLTSLTVVDGGTIRMIFDGASGVEGGIVEWVPHLGEIESMGLQWQCLSADYPRIARALPDCTYVARQAVEAE
ncbi:MAG: pilin [Dokdonella sp.]|jgi:hypothetical protein|uniref:pilin n=1 Tax=Dokdonella sp. TaxID=2291710 RepID=UPI001B67360C|nr:pilin [Dokdonella sp.]MBK8124998.1 pilin [Dokdonella sp.]MBP6327645.1 pilin [Dokdonella sp.]MBP6328298.1 pilin [Dokdonella sp.]HNV08831.1 pilin [Dokdonella sp.]HPW05210.1 pilin [Dokdonella sp.]